MPKEASLAAMKHLSRKHKIALVELVVLVLLVVWFIAPRPLTRAMAGDGFDPAAVTQIQADLTAFQGGEGRTLTFSQGEPAFSQLMDLLQSKRYIPYYLDQDAQRSVTLGYRVDLTFSQGEAWPSEAPPPAARGVYGVCHGLFAAFSQMIMTTILAQTGESTTDFARFPKIFII